MDRQRNAPGAWRGDEGKNTTDSAEKEANVPQDIRFAPEAQAMMNYLSEAGSIRDRLLAAIARERPSWSDTVSVDDCDYEGVAGVTFTHQFGQVLLERCAVVENGGIEFLDDVTRPNVFVTAPEDMDANAMRALAADLIAAAAELEKGGRTLRRPSSVDDELRERDGGV